MRELLARLGGRALVCSRIGRSDSTMKDWMARGAFSPQAYGEFLRLAADCGELVDTDLFGLSWEDHWPSVAQRAADATRGPDAHATDADAAA